MKTQLKSIVLAMVVLGFTIMFFEKGGNGIIYVNKTPNDATFIIRENGTVNIFSSKGEIVEMTYEELIENIKELNPDGMPLPFSTIQPYIQKEEKKNPKVPM